MILLSSCFHKGAFAKGERKQEQIKIQQQKEEAANSARTRKHHFDIQTKMVQKRIKEDEKKTSEYYNKKLKRSFFSRLFGKKKRN